jgi:DNA mismatch endonuclease, patch repair protein
MKPLWVQTARSRQLTGRRAKDTAPEIAARRALHRAGYRFRIHVRLAPGCRPDILLPRHRVAVFCHGDFWHGCSDHYQPPGGPNASLWSAKIDENRRRDVRATEIASDLGWVSVTVWECELKTDPTVAVRLVDAARRP